MCDDDFVDLMMSVYCSDGDALQDVAEWLGYPGYYDGDGGYLFQCGADFEAVMRRLSGRGEESRQ